jgi:hypothetical protein
VFHGVAAYALDAAGSALVEHRLDGSTLSYPLTEPPSGQRATLTVEEDGSQVIRGRADADLVVVTAGGEAVALDLPAGPAGQLQRFTVTLDAPTADLRLFALGDGRAAEISLTGG